ncbi:hypothetical protein [Thermaerobacter litoralis]
MAAADAGDGIHADRMGPGIPELTVVADRMGPEVPERSVLGDLMGPGVPELDVEPRADPVDHRGWWRHPAP